MKWSLKTETLFFQSKCRTVKRHSSSKTDKTSPELDCCQTPVGHANSCLYGTAVSPCQSAPQNSPAAQQSGEGGARQPGSKIIALHCLHFKSLSLTGGDALFWGKKKIPLLLALNYSVAVPNVTQQQRSLPVLPLSTLFSVWVTQNNVCFLKFDVWD